MKVALTSDLHGALPVIEPCDLLIIAGDVCPVHNHSEEFQWDWLERDFAQWLESVPAKHIVAIAGNHDFLAQSYPEVFHGLPWEYLFDSGTDYGGLAIYGTPWVPNLPNWAFYGNDDTMTERFSHIPMSTDILVSHGPPHGILDKVLRGMHVGSKPLDKKVWELKDPKLVVFGHIHEAYGIFDSSPEGPIFVNAALMDVNYEPVNPVRMIEL